MKKMPAGKLIQMPLAGVSALAEMTMITPPRIPVYALGLEEYQQTNPKGFHISHKDDADFILEIWNYNPKLLTQDTNVDPFSLFLSLQNTFDERIGQALTELMEKIEW